MPKKDQAVRLRQALKAKGLDETNPKALEALWSELSEPIRAACEIEAELRGCTPQALGAQVIRDLLQHYDAQAPR